MTLEEALAEVSRLREIIDSHPNPDTRALVAAVHHAGFVDREERDALRAALLEALEGWEYAAFYKGDYLAKKHGDAEDIARLRAVLAQYQAGDWPAESEGT